MTPSARPPRSRSQGPPWRTRLSSRAPSASLDPAFVDWQAFWNAAGKGKGNGKGKGKGKDKDKGKGKGKGKTSGKTKGSGVKGKGKDSYPLLGDQALQHEDVQKRRGPRASSFSPWRRGARTVARPFRGSQYGPVPRDHPDGLRLEELQMGVRYRGVIVNTAPFGIFVDVGAERNGILGVPARTWKYFKRGDILDEVFLERVDLELREFAVTIADPEGTLEKLHRPLSDFSVGMDIPVAVVVDWSGLGTYLNVGCVKDSMLKSRFGRPLYYKGQVLRNLTMMQVDESRGTLSVGWDCEEKALASREACEMVGFKLLDNTAVARADTSPLAPPAPPRLTEGQGQALAMHAGPAKPTKLNGRPLSAKAKTAKQPKGKLQASQEDVNGGTSPIPFAREENGLIFGPSDNVEDIQVGDFVNGDVVAISKQGVHVNIGLEWNGLLVVPPKLKKEFQMGDRVQGMTVDYLDERKEIVKLSIEDPELEFDGTDPHCADDGPAGPQLEHCDDPDDLEPPLPPAPSLQRGRRLDRGREPEATAPRRRRRATTPRVSAVQPTPAPTPTIRYMRG